MTVLANHSNINNLYLFIEIGAKGFALPSIDHVAYLNPSLRLLQVSVFYVLNICLYALLWNFCIHSYNRNQLLNLYMKNQHLSFKNWLLFILELWL